MSVCSPCEAVPACAQGRVKAFDKAMHVQTELTRAVTADPDLHSKASDAFRSFVRAYSTHCKSMEAFFHVKQLHLGHVAHSFGLRYALLQLLELASLCLPTSDTGSACSAQPTLIGKSATSSAKLLRRGRGGKQKQRN